MVAEGRPLWAQGVTAMDDLAAHNSTPISHLGFIPGWKPYLPTGCKVATNGDMSRCTDAHYLYPFLRQPLFIRENQYDTAKLANCGFDARSSTDTSYLKLWGEWMRAQLGVIRQSPKDGYFSASCLEHGGNFGWLSSPVIGGVTMREALSNWYFEKGNASMQYTADLCAESSADGLPCTAVTGAQSCPHYAAPAPQPGPPGKLTPQCLAAANKLCGAAKGTSRCAACIHAHGRELKAATCPHSAAPMVAAFCGAPAGGLGEAAPAHHVCDLSLPSRLARFGV